MPKKEGEYRPEKFANTRFATLWEYISEKRYYHVELDQERLVARCKDNLNQYLRTGGESYTIVKGTAKVEEERHAVEMQVKETENHLVSATKTSTPYDLLGRIANDTRLTRQMVAEILSGIDKNVFDQYHDNPEDFMLKASKLINGTLKGMMAGNVEYKKTGKRYTEEEVFKKHTPKGVIGESAIESEKGLYSIVELDSKNIEKPFAEELELSADVETYVKLPTEYKINTPYGNYSPDWAVVFKDNDQLNVYFIAETKGTEDPTELREVEQGKIECARKHFKAISDGKVRYYMVKSFLSLVEKRGDLRGS